MTEGTKTALVTGGTVRLGAAIAAGLRARGWRVLTTSHRQDAGADLVADFAAPGGALALADELRRMRAAPIDALVNNAALFTGSAGTVRAVGLEAPLALMRAFAEGRETPGAIVNVLDCNVLRGEGSAATPYLEAKRRLRDETILAAMRWAPIVRVNAVAPGPVLAPVGVHEPAGEMPLAQRPTPDDVADAVAYLLGAESVTGVILPVDAGQHLVGAYPEK